MTTTIGFIGTGNIATAMLRGLIQAKMDKSVLYACNRSQEKLKHLQDALGFHACSTPEDVAQKADVVVLCVKPIDMAAVSKQISSVVGPDAIVVSVASGITMQTLSAWFSASQPLVRAMPNTPVSVNKGCIGLYTKNCGESHTGTIDQLFSKLGETFFLEDELSFDLLTAVSGCGPGFVFYLMEIFQAAARDKGLPEAVVRELLIKTFEGAAILAGESTDSFASLKNRVAPKGGLTETGLSMMCDNRFGETFQQVIDTILLKTRGHD